MPQQNAPRKQPAPGNPHHMNHREPDFAYETFKCGHIIGLLMLGVLLCQLGSVSVVSSDEVTKYIVFVVLLGLFLPYGIYTTGYLRRASSLDRTLSSIFLFACTVISVIAAVYVVPAFYYVTALLLFVVLICEWVGPLTAYWNGEKVEFSTLKSSSTKPVYGATPYEQPGQPGQAGYPGSQNNMGSMGQMDQPSYGAPYGQQMPAAPYGHSGQPGQFAQPGQPPYSPQSDQFGQEYPDPRNHGQNAQTAQGAQPTQTAPFDRPDFSAPHGTTDDGSADNSSNSMPGNTSE